VTAQQRTSVPDPITRALLGWQPARVLMTANRLNVFNVLGEEQLNAAAIAAHSGCHPRSMKLLLNACVALGFLEKRGRQFANTPSGREVLLRGKPAYIGDGINHADALWFRWAFLTDSVRSNRSARTPPGPVDGATGYRDFILAMHNRAMRNAAMLADHLDLTGRRQLFDAGGGPGTYTIFLLKKHPQLGAIIFDLPPAIEIARQIVHRFGMTDRVTFRPGNFHEDDFGEGNDVVLFSAIFHSLSPQRAKALLSKAHNSLVGGGLVVVHEGLVNDDKVSPVSAVLFSLNMLVNVGGGRSYSAREIMSWLTDAGFVSPRLQHLPPSAGTSLVLGTRP